MKILMICNTDGALYVFRQPIIEAAISEGHTVHTISGESDYFDRLRRLGTQPVAMDFARHSIGLGDNLRLSVELWRHMRAIKPDVVHGFTHKPAIYGTLAARLAGVRALHVTITGLGTLFVRTGWKAALLRFALLAQYRLALRFARRVYFQNPDDLNYFVSHRVVNADKAVLTGGSGIDLAKYPLPCAQEETAARANVAAELTQSLDGKIFVLFPARGVREKGFFEMYEGARQLHARRPGRYVVVHLGLIDSASSGVISREGIEAYAHECGVHYLGFRNDIDRYMRACDVVALPSYREGTPRSLIEALAFGKAVVTTDAPGCKETVVVGENGLLCRVGDAASLSEALLKIDESFVAHARSRSRSLCESKYDAARIVDLTLAGYVESTARP
jgi:N,N'-diacetylbacillosaminyl-diphospho-undecaprenol alpha-1,3-N-acetylgalactosaminyltransferase